MTHIAHQDFEQQIFQTRERDLPVASRNRVSRGIHNQVCCPQQERP